MTRTLSGRLFASLVLAATLAGCTESLEPGQVRTGQGVVSATTSDTPGVRAWHGIPYAAPPVGEKRWTAPEPPDAWEGVRSGEPYGNRCMQTNPWPDMIWNSPAESEDCLYLNIWAPEVAEGLPVMVWIHGGGFFAGASDETRHEGSVLASKGVVLVTINYRLGVLGFLAHPELTAQSTYGASGNYGLLDMVAALEWVRDNITGFGGNPDNVTIFGESAGSFAVSDLMSSPLAKGLFHRAIGQSGGHFGTSALNLMPLSAAETAGAELGSLADLRSKSPADLVASLGPNPTRFSVILDGHVLPTDPWTRFEERRQNDVPLMAGWTSAEIKGWRPTLEEFQGALARQFAADVAGAMAVYRATTDAEAVIAATAMTSDGFVVYPTWKWIELQTATGTEPAYRYVFDQVMATASGPVPADDPGAAHASDIPFVFNTLASTGNPISNDDVAVADLMATYWANFARTGNPNGEGLPTWPAFRGDGSGQVMRLNASAAAEPESDRARFEFLDRRQVAQRTGS